MLYPVKKGLPFYINLKILEVYNYYPLNNQSKFKYFTILCIWSLMWNATAITGAICLFISSMIKHDYYLATTALPIAMGGSVVLAINILFGVQYEKWSDLLERTTDYTKFGKSLNFDKIIRQGDKMGKILYLCSFFSTIFIAAFEIFTEKKCLLSNSGRNEICGLIIPYWLPSGHKSSIVFKRCALIHQIFAIFVGVAYTAILNLQNQICLFIEDKVKHLSVLFNKISTVETSTLQQQQFSFCMEYYQHILKICEQLDSTSQKTLGHVTLSTSIVVSIFLYHGMRGNYTLLYAAELFLINLAFMCYTGQTLEDAMSQVGDFLYMSCWYDCSIDIQKRIPFVIMRSQRFAGLRAVPIGRLNYLLFAAVMKTTYTYLNLMKNTGTH